MASRLYSRNAVLLAKIETTEGSDSSPSGAANAILCSELSIEPLAGSSVDLAYIRPYFGRSQSIRVEDYVTITLTVDLAGTATAGTAASWGPLLRACGMAETLLAAAVTGTAASATTSSVTLAAGASSTDGIYVGADITIGGNTRTIISYVGSTKVATVNKAFPSIPSGSYTIGANATYSPVSSGFESLTLYYNQNGVRHKALGCRGTASFNLAANNRPTMQFTFTGNFGGIADASETGVVFSSWQVPVAVNSANSSALVQGKLADGSATGIQLMSFSLDLGNAVTHRTLVGAENVILTDRQAQGSLSVEATTVTFYDWWTQIRNAATAPLLIENGTVAGNKVGLFMPKAQLTDPKYSDSDGVVMLDTTVLAVPDVGNDELRVVVK